MRCRPLLRRAAPRPGYRAVLRTWGCEVVVGGAVLTGSLTAAFPLGSGKFWRKMTCCLGKLSTSSSRCWKTPWAAPGGAGSAKVRQRPRARMRSPPSPAPWTETQRAGSPPSPTGQPPSRTTTRPARLLRPGD